MGVAMVPSRKPIGIWIRVSTEDQARGDSPEHHEKRARAYAVSRDWLVTEVYHLEGVSGKSVLDHPEARRMIDDIRCKRITGLVFSKLARLARSTRELLWFADLFRDEGADLISLQESIDTSTPAGRLFYTMIAAMAQWEREEIADRVSGSLQVRARLGKPLNGKIVFGYQWQNKKVEPHPHEAQVRKIIFGLLLKYRNKTAVARELNRRGYRMRSGAQFNGLTIDRLIRDPTAKGMYRANFTTNRAPNGKKRLLKPVEDWAWTKVEPIVSESIWDECNQLLDRLNAARRKRQPNPMDYVLAGLLRCKCGCKLISRGSGERSYRCQNCKVKIPIIDLEAIYYQQLKGFFCCRDAIAKELQAAERSRVDDKRTLDIHFAELNRLDAEARRALELYAGDRLDQDAFSKLYQPVKERRRQLGQSIRVLESRVTGQRVDQVAIDHAVKEAHRLYARWPEMEQTEQRQIVESLTKQIAVGHEEIAITLTSSKTQVHESVKWQRRIIPGQCRRASCLRRSWSSRCVPAC